MKIFAPQILRCLSCRAVCTGWTVNNGTDEYFIKCTKQDKLPDKKCKYYLPAEGSEE